MLVKMGMQMLLLDGDRAMLIKGTTKITLWELSNSSSKLELKVELEFKGDSRLLEPTNPFLHVI